VKVRLDMVELKHLVERGEINIEAHEWKGTANIVLVSGKTKASDVSALEWLIRELPTKKAELHWGDNL